MNETNFKVGDVVKLKSVHGGVHNMTVITPITNKLDKDSNWEQVGISGKKPEQRGRGHL
jgi:hypothetical protein